nr:MAG TPA: hypothetical protein [Caudoviricetes sp.]
MVACGLSENAKESPHGAILSVWRVYEWRRE